MKELKRIGVLTSGGDAPGMNAAVRAVVRTAIANGVEVMGIYRGYSGLIDGDIRPLTLRSVSNVINKGGTILYSDRCLEFITPEGQMKGVETCKRFGIDGIVALGGDGTFRGAMALTRHGIPSVGVPCTIDNDITSTDVTIGFDTAVNTTLELIDKLRDTCESHARCNVVEVMGRNAGDIAIFSGLASGATAIAVPEFPFDENKLCEQIERSKKVGKRNFIVVVSEGLGSEYAPALAKTIHERTGVETKFARFAHIVRGGNPNMGDRILASSMGAFAVEKLLEGKQDILICSRHGEIVETNIRYALTLDRYYKGQASDEEIAAFSTEDFERMKAHCEERRAQKQRYYDVSNTINI